MFTKIDKKNLSEEIVRQLISRILGGALTPGTKLPPERDLAEQMYVNRNTLREALKKLELLGLLNVRQGDGIYVLDYRDSGNLELLKYILYTRKKDTPEILKDILSIRTLVIPEMAASAAKKISDNEIEMLKGILADDSISIIEKDMAIHMFIARVSSNLPFMLILNFFNDIFRQYADIYFAFEENRNVTNRFHKSITESLTQKDFKKSKSVMHDVLTYTEQCINSYMEKNYEKS